MEPIVITGASGFLGSSFLVRILMNPAVTKVYVLARRPLDPTDRYLQKLLGRADEAQKLWTKVEVLQVDLSQTDRLQTVLQDLARRESQKFRVFHLAAQISEKADADFIRRLNVDATRVIAEWSNQWASRLTFISTVAAFGSSRDPRPRGESSFAAYDPFCRHSVYFESKRIAHQTLVATCEIPYDVFCPSVIHGPWDSLKDTRSRLNPFLKKGFRWVPPGGANFVALSKILGKLEASLQRPAAAPTRVEMVVGANWTFKKYIELYLKFYGIDRNLKTLPVFIFRCLEFCAPLLPKNKRSLLHGARFLFFRSEFETDSVETIEAQTVEAVAASVRCLNREV